MKLREHPAQPGCHKDGSLPASPVADGEWQIHTNPPIRPAELVRSGMYCLDAGK